MTTNTKNEWRKTLTIWALMVAVGVGLFEAALRLSPSLISLPFLARFHPDLRADIAAATGLPTSAAYRSLATSQRSDGGRPLALFEPNATYLWPTDADDLAAGALEHQTSDAYGFCNPVGAYEAAPVDVLVIGGSVPSCTGVHPNETFAAQLGKITGLKTYNMTVGGSGPNDYVQVLRNFGLSLKPRMVVMAYAESNDIRDCLLHEAFVADATPAPAATPPSALNPMRYSHALNFIYAGGATLVKSVKRSTSEDFRFQAMVQGKPYAFNTRNGDIDELVLARNFQANPKLIESCRAPLADFAALGKANAFIPVIMLVPAAYTAYGEGTTFNDPAIAAAMANLHTGQSSWLAEQASGLGYHYIDETRAYTNTISTRPPAFFPSNVHFSADGQNALAQTMAPAISRLFP